MVGVDYFDDDLDDFLVEDEPVVVAKSKPKPAPPAAKVTPRPPAKASGSSLSSIKTQAELSKEVSDTSPIPYFLCKYWQAIYL